MENYYELEDITLIPSVTNSGHLGNTADYSVTDPNDQTGYAQTLPIFTSPSSAIIGKENIKDFVDHGIKPVIPACDPLVERLELCQWVFCAALIRCSDYYNGRKHRYTRSLLSVCSCWF